MSESEKREELKAILSELSNKENLEKELDLIMELFGYTISKNMDHG